MMARLSMPVPTAAAPLPGPNADVVDYSGLFVMPGLIDVHTHLAYGNAKTEEDIDLYQPLEFRAIRGLFFAQKVVAGRLHVDLRARRCRPDQPLGPQRHPGRPVRGPARHGRRPLPDHAAGPDRLVSDLDRRAGDLDRASGVGTRRGDRGDPPPGQERRRLHQDRARRLPSPTGWRARSPPSRRKRRRSWCRRRTASARKWWCMRAAARRRSMRRAPASISSSTPTISTTSASRRC